MCIDDTVRDVQSFHHHHLPPREATTFQKSRILTEAWLKKLYLQCLVESLHFAGSHKKSVNLKSEQAELYIICL